MATFKERLAICTIGEYQDASVVFLRAKPKTREALHARLARTEHHIRAQALAVLDCHLGFNSPSAEHAIQAIKPEDVLAIQLEGAVGFLMVHPSSFAFLVACRDRVDLAVAIRRESVWTPGHSDAQMAAQAAAQLPEEGLPAFYANMARSGFDLHAITDLATHVNPDLVSSRKTWPRIAKAIACCGHHGLEKALHEAHILAGTDLPSWQHEIRDVLNARVAMREQTGRHSMSAP